jgi:putative nucleotidyltransferase with HDIG domain
MNVRSNGLENDNELKFSREQGFFDKSLGVKILLVLLFIISLFMFLHFREVRVEMFELGSIAPKYVVAQVDLDFYDEEATIILKQESSRDVGKIYRITDNRIRDARLNFEKFLYNDAKWVNEGEGRTLDMMYTGGDLLEKNMRMAHFSDPRTLQKMAEVKLPTTFYLVYTPSDVKQPVILPEQIWKELGVYAFSNRDFSQNSIDFILQFFAPLKWQLEEDIGAQEAVRQRIQGKVPDKYTHVSAGSRIIDQGEKVTSRHIAILQAMKDELTVRRSLWHFSTLVGSAILASLLALMCGTYYYINYPEVIASNRKLFLVITVMMLTFILAKGTELFFLNFRSNALELIPYPLLVPFAAILLCNLMNAPIATFTSGFLTIIMMMGLAFDPQGFMIVNLTAALACILSSRYLHQRREIFVVCLKAWLCCIVVIFSLHLYENSDWTGFGTDILSAGGFMLLTAVLVVGLLPLMESTFRVMTDVTLVEYMDPNHDLLRRLSIEAPGTYQHSVVVGNLAEAAALSIGANGLFCRAATLYHDVGKMATPQYFTENQHGGMNIHQLLTPRESAQVIIAHISEGVALARKAGLPEQFIDVIKEHHGTTLVYYFYRKELDRVSNDMNRVDVKEFRYGGPKPRSKESAIVMIADSMEAASRSLEIMNYESLTDLVERIVKEKMADHQFDHSLLTLEELAKVKETLVKTLVAYGHSRVKYPKRELGEELLQDEA